MKEICFFGRGGQGVVKSAQVIVQSVVEEGLYAHFIPSFGVERKGSPVYGFLRSDDKDIRLKCKVYNPDAVVIYDDSLMSLPATFSGLKDGAAVLINTTKSLDQLYDMGLPKIAGHVFAVDATHIAIETIKLDIPNTVMLGAYGKAIGGMSFETLKKNVGKTFGEANAAAAQAGYDAVRLLKD